MVKNQSAQYVVKTSTLFIITMLVLFLSACGPIGGEPGNTQAEEPPKENSDNPETAAVAQATEAEESTGTHPVIDSNLAQTDAKGLQVGFTEDGHPYRGNPDAPVVMREFSDFQCPFCGRFAAQTLPLLEQNQIANGDVLLIFYDFPLTNIHPQAIPAANAAHCAGESGPANYWAMHDRLFLNIGEWANGNANSFFVQYASELNLDVENFSSCLDSNKYADVIQQDLTLGQSRGVRSTPSFFLNEQMLVGAQPISAFNNAIASVAGGQTIAAAPTSPPPPPQTAEDVLAPARVVPTPAAIPTDGIAGTLGDPNAPVTIVEFSDFQCPFCQRHSLETMPQIVTNLIETGDVYYIFKDLPLDSLHPDARAAANAARCAGDQDAYIEMHDALFANQEQWAGVGAGINDAFVALASNLGVDEGEFRSCVEENRYADVIQANVTEASSLQAQSTPYFFIDGYPVSGAQPFDLFEYAVGLAKEGDLASAYAPAAPEVAEAFAIGDPNAPVTIVEYTDFQCPFCSRHFAQAYPQIVQNFVDTGKVRYIFKDFPLTNIHPQAVLAAEAAHCAEDQDSYLEMHGLLFQTQGQWNGNHDAANLFIQYAQQIGLDTDAFTTCMTNHTYQTAIQASLEEGQAQGIRGTPAFLINGRLMSGAQPYQIFEQAINSVLESATQ